MSDTTPTRRRYWVGVRRAWPMASRAATTRRKKSITG
jgi:hypothetical protein